MKFLIRLKDNILVWAVRNQKIPDYVKTNMTTNSIKATQEIIGATPDGSWGPISIRLCQKYLSDLMPANNPWPKSDQASLTKFYGKAGDESKLVNLDVRDLQIKYEGSLVKSKRGHSKVAESLKRVLTAIYASPFQYVLNDYAGCYNNRPMRGGSTPSLHARGAAIDLRPDSNGNRSHWPTASDMPIEVMAIFALEGWLSAGAFWGRDSMHFQATR